jgi:superfamily II DNA/RNA helicase
MMSTTTSLAKANPTKKRVCGSKTKLRSFASPRAPIRSSLRNRGQLESLMEWGLGYESRADSRLDRLITFLDAVCRPDGKTWSNERVVVFTEYAHTVDWLTRVLNQRGYTDGRLAVIQGSTPTEDREYIRSQFTADPAKEPVRVLLATDAAGEGIDLQTYCHRLGRVS